MTETGNGEFNLEDLSHSAEISERTALPEELKPHGAALQKYIPKPDLYNVAHPEGADLPHHGVLHGEETMILAAVMLNIAYEDVKARLGEEAANAFRAKIDEPALYYGASYHDCARISDWRLLQGEMKQHGPRGAGVIKERADQVDPDLSEESVDRMVDLISRHHEKPLAEKRDLKDLLLGRIRRKSESGAAQKVDTPKNFEEYEPHELSLRLLQEADKLGTPRAYYSRKPESPRRTVFAMVVNSAREVKSRLPIVRRGPGALERRLRFQQTRDVGLPQIADALTRMSRRDPEINRKFAFVPHRSGAAIEAAKKIQLVKP